jgi:hypothetical protein
MKNSGKSLRVSKKAFDETLAKLLDAKPLPRTHIEKKGKRGPKTPILSR